MFLSSYAAFAVGQALYDGRLLLCITRLCFAMVNRWSIVLTDDLHCLDLELGFWYSRLHATKAYEQRLQAQDWFAFEHRPMGGGEGTRARAKGREREKGGCHYVTSVRMPRLKRPFSPFFPPQRCAAVGIPMMYHVLLVVAVLEPGKAEAIDYGMFVANLATGLLLCWFFTHPRPRLFCAL